MENIKTWYANEFPTDELGNEINSEATFDGLKDELPRVYTYIGVSDSIVRERVFSKMAEIMNVDYETIYKSWLNIN